ncbi:MAG TPA: DUF3592 domain-containing protein [Anaerolineales bacterium]|nr:DUF3592 domain-containing protein [Anaerolineales bacterium]
MDRSQPPYSVCPWCGTRNLWGLLECRRCGGPQPAVETADAGPNPPPPPRSVPPGYARHLFFTHVIGLVGAIFFVTGLPFLVIFPAVALATGDWLFLAIGGSLGALFAMIGGLMFAAGIRHVGRTIETYRTGLTARGAVVDVVPDRSITVNGRNPWRVTYTYKVMGISHGGNTHTWYPLVEAGSPVHVLYRPNEPDVSALYPPLYARRS